MSLRINTNVAALNSYNNLSANQTKLEGAFQQLSSGLRINKAADDAAGLSIAQGLTSQINGLTQAVSNANDGINVAQIADGALGTTQDILQRMRGLVVKAGNVGTQDSKSLTAIQEEVQNLNKQLDNIAGQTKFGQTNLLDGSYSKNFQVGANGGDVIKLDLSGAGVSSNDIGGTNLNGLNIAVGSSGTGVSNIAVDSAKAFADPTTNFKAGNALFDTLGGADFFGTKLTTGSTLSAPTGGESGWVVKDSAGNQLGTISQAANGSILVTQDDGTNPPKQLGAISSTQAAGTTASIDGTTVSSAMSDALNKAFTGATGTAFTATGNSANGWAVTNGTNTALVTLSNGAYTITDTTAGSDSVNKVIGAVDSTTTTASGGVLSYSSDNAKDDLVSIDKAIDAMSKSRSQIGAVQNQLNYTVSNLNTAITNVTASRSNLTDADLAQQVTAMTQSQILTQAATSVLAQANSAPQAILKLLQ